MLLLLDTNAISDVMSEQPRVLRNVVTQPAANSVITCSIAMGEIWHGIARLGEGKRRNDLQTKAEIIERSVRCEAVPSDAAKIYASIKLAKQQMGSPMGENDLWIAATAIASGATLVTRDSDFQGIPNLSLVDWSL